ncbi:hypothetical protein SMGD1_2857 [Sulfurimonas gotlandica GD1]|uniref:Uncharacterized protein n=1 Tax=Sulfurimonas gotlandica (strain DSM 19862 / JCM 16533 / GD1) TaxID=929558 RepID=B6BJX7_SULGG|nr:hypothetical protein [Sulfurimonas gotlandica]EDZ62578.1 conserved hypothetical protein [Sulfurimonas gotlandica GD1]EHP31379.1 hypothetical protein SMGD1_2857 [Sulfurimonas gotlandica GD1]
MQTFGKFSTNFDQEYLTKHYIYINEKDENREDILIDINDLEEMLKKKRKTVAGTIFLYNPTISPVGFNTNSLLAKQGFVFDDKFHELNFNDMMNLFSKSIRDGYRGKLLEIKYLFGLNRGNIEPTPILEELDADLDKYNSNQLTRFDKQLNYQDYLNLSLNGKFVYFGSGHKHDRHHKEIIAYARNIAAQAVKLGKEIYFTHDNNYAASECVDVAYFLAPLAVGKIKEKRINAFKNAFRTNPPTIQKLQ